MRVCIQRTYVCINLCAKAWKQTVSPRPLRQRQTKPEANLDWIKNGCRTRLSVIKRSSRARTPALFLSLLLSAFKVRHWRRRRSFHSTKRVRRSRSLAESNQYPTSQNYPLFSYTAFPYLASQTGLETCLSFPPVYALRVLVHQCRVHNPKP